MSASLSALADGLSTTELFLNALVLWLASIGFGILVALAVNVATAIYRAKVRKPYDLVKRYGKGWAIVTGATDGIGKAAAWQLAKRGLNVLLVSRTQSKLDEVKAELNAKFPGVKVETLQIDFCNFDQAAQDKVAQAFTGLAEDGGVAVLVNNVGVSYDFPMYFHELSDARVADMVKLNIDSTTYMTRIALKFMRERKGGKRRGAIINVGSAAGSTSNPLLTQYSAAKAYVQRLTEGLAVEYGPQGIDVQVHVPFFIVSKLSKFKKASFFVPSAETYARMLCDRIGYEVVVNPHLPHTLLGYVIQKLPTGPRESYTRSMHLGIRSKAQKKLGEKKE